MNSLLNRLKNGTEEQLDSYITEALALANMTNDTTHILGFENSVNLCFHQGFIPFDTKISFSTVSDKTYSMKTTDIYYEFSKYIVEKGITKEDEFIKELYKYITKYFGALSSLADRRDEYLEDLAFQTSSTDQEYHENLEKLEIGCFRGKGIALSPERTAIAQNILTIFGFETYFCSGTLDFDGDRKNHCFNIVCINDSYTIVDFTIPCHVVENELTNDYIPFQCKLEENELEEILTRCTPKSSKDYIINRLKGTYTKIPSPSCRTYVVGGPKIKRTLKIW